MRGKRQYQFSFAVSAGLIFVYSLMLGVIPPSQIGAAPRASEQAAQPTLNEHIVHVEGTAALVEAADGSLQ